MPNILVENPYSEPVEIPAHLPAAYRTKETQDVPPQQAVSPEVATPTGPLSADHLRQLSAAGERLKKLSKVSKVAPFNGWNTGFFFSFFIPFAFFSLTSALMGIALGVVTWNEFRGRKRFQQFDIGSLRLLGWNQVGFMSALIVYSLWMIVSVLVGPSPYEEQFRQNPELRGMVGNVEALYLVITLAVYAQLIVFTAGFQGLNAWYYFSRKKHLQAYVDETPEWVLDIQRSTAAS